MDASERKDAATILDEWAQVAAPSPPKPQAVRLDPARTALLVLDMQRQNCNCERRPRCVESVPRVQALLENARNAGVAVLYSLTSSAEPGDILEDLSPRPDEAIVRSGANKFHGTDLEDRLCVLGVRTVVLVGTSAHGAVLNTATAAALRGLDVVVPVDGMSAGEPYAEQYTCWHLANSPGTRRRAVLTRCDLIAFERADE
jgi:nicotinamidase-related amidase